MADDVCDKCAACGRSKWPGKTKESFDFVLTCAGDPLCAMLSEKYFAGISEGERRARSRQNTCVVCSALLIPDDESPPHCIDTCVPTEEDEAEWRRRAEERDDGE